MGVPSQSPDEIQSNTPPQLPAKIADRPHLWTVGLAAAALLVSIASAVFSWMNGRVADEALRLSKESSLPAVRATTAAVKMVSDVELDVMVTFVNFGRTEAKRLRAVLIVIGSKPGDGNRRIVFDLGAEFPSLAPGETRVEPMTARLEGSGTFADYLGHEDATLELEGEFSYDNEIDHKTPVGSMCWEIKPFGSAKEIAAQPPPCRWGGEYHLFDIPTRK